MSNTDVTTTPVVTGHDPTGSASTDGGETVTITGSSFTGVNVVGFGPYGSSFEVISDTEIRATAPAVDPSVSTSNPVAKITVWKDSRGSDDTDLPEWTWGGRGLGDIQTPLTDTTGGDGADMNTVPVVTGHDPSGSASTDGGETVTISGSSFTGVNAVGFGPYGTSFEVISDTEIRATAPAVDPSVSTSNPVAKITVWKNTWGSDDTNLPEWTWGGRSLADIQTPLTDTTGGDGADMDTTPEVTGHDPAGSASTDGGETVTITGSSFTGVNAVGFGPFSGSFEVISDTEIRATAPAVDPSVSTSNPVAKVTVWKDSRGSDDTNLPEWTWGGQTLGDIQSP